MLRIKDFFVTIFFIVVISFVITLCKDDNRDKQDKKQNKKEGSDNTPDETSDSVNIITQNK